MAIDNILNATDDSCYNIEDSSTSSDVDSSNIVQPKRNEVDEIKKLSSKDTSRVRRWRFLVTTCLLATAVAIATASYKFLASEQEAAFEEAVSCNISDLQNTVVKNPSHIAPPAIRHCQPCLVLAILSLR